MDRKAIDRELKRITEAQSGRSNWYRGKQKKLSRSKRKKKRASDNRKRNVRNIQKPFASKNGNPIYGKYIRSGIWFRRRAEFLKKFPNCIKKVPKETIYLG